MKNTVLIDTNIILDFLLHRAPFYSDANKIMTLCAKQTVKGYVAFHSISNLFFILRKYTNEEQRRKLLIDLCNILTVTAASHLEVQNAIENQNFKDFEDCLQDKCAIAVRADFIITRNLVDYKESETPAMSPSVFLKNLSSEQ